MSYITEEGERLRNEAGWVWMARAMQMHIFDKRRLCCKLMPGRDSGDPGVRCLLLEAHAGEDHLGIGVSDNKVVRWTDSGWSKDGQKVVLGGVIGLRPDSATPVATLTASQAGIAAECDAIKAMLLAKNEDYGDSALHPIRIFSKASAEEQILVRIDDKVNRIIKGKAGGEDVAKDLIGYFILLRVKQRLDAAAKEKA